MRLTVSAVLNSQAPTVPGARSAPPTTSSPPNRAPGRRPRTYSSGGTRHSHWMPTSLASLSVMRTAARAQLVNLTAAGAAVHVAPGVVERVFDHDGAVRGGHV